MTLNCPRRAIASQFRRTQRPSIALEAQPPEARRVALNAFKDREMFRIDLRHITGRIGYMYPINPNLKALLDKVLTDPRWDLKFIGMQIIIEGLALAAFGYLHQLTTEPLLKHLLRYVMSDEARHVAFGVLSLKEVYDGMSDLELKDRQEFAFEAAVRMRDRFMSQEVWERMGVNMREIMPLVLNDPTRQVFQSMLFSKIVPNCKKLGLLDRNESWLRRRFEEMNVIQFEDWVDTGEEYSSFEIGSDMGSQGY